MHDIDRLNYERKDLEDIVKITTKTNIKAFSY